MKTHSCPSDDELFGVCLNELHDYGISGHLKNCIRCRDRLTRLSGKIQELRQLDVSFLEDSQSNGNQLKERLRTHPTPADEDIFKTVSVGPSTFGGPSSLGAASTSGAMRFHILREHARGGLGIVYVAHDRELNREVALKEIKGDFADDHYGRDRFLLEAEVTGRLEHPGIVPVYSLGKYPDGRPFYAMRFIQGDSLNAAIKEFQTASPQLSDTERNIRLRRLLQRFIDVCEALEYAHSCKVLHRDLKPANIMLGKYGETLVVDWGLARMDNTDRQWSIGAPDQPPLHPQAEPTLTATGQVLGTPNYMSPEQATGQLDQLGPATDIYSLGGTLYTILTGQPPISGKSTTEVLDKVRQGQVIPPRQLNRGIPRALEAIALHALALEPAQRYPSAKALLTDIECYLADEPVTAYREPITARARRWARKRPGLVSGTAATVAVTLIALLAGTVVLGQKNHELAQANIAEKQQRQRAEREEATAKANEKQAREQEAIATAVKNFLIDDLLELARPEVQAEAKDKQVNVDPDLRVQDLFVRAERKIEERFTQQPHVATELQTLITKSLSQNTGGLRGDEGEP